MNFFLFFERAFCENSSVNILGIDYGHKRVGLSYADTTLGVAVPIDAAVESTAEARMSHIERVIKERRINKIIIGYPFNMDGTIGDKAREVDAYIKELEKFGLEIERVDERLSSFQAENDFFAMSPRTKKSVAARKKHRKSGDIDSRASAIFLQEWLDTNSQH